MLTKEKLLKTSEVMPREKFNDIDKVLEEIIFIDKIENSLSAAEKNEVLSEEEVDKEISRW